MERVQNVSTVNKLLTNNHCNDGVDLFNSSSYSTYRQREKERDRKREREKERETVLDM